MPCNIRVNLASLYFPIIINASCHSEIDSPVPCAMPANIVSNSMACIVYFPQKNRYEKAISVLLFVKLILVVFGFVGGADLLLDRERNGFVTA